VPRPTLTLLLGLLILPALGARGRAGESGARVLCDFETGEPTDTWQHEGLGVADVTVAPGATAAGGRGLKLIGGGAEGSVRHPVEVADWRTYRALSLYAAVESPEKVEMRVLALSGRGSGAMLKRFALAPGPWREVVLPLSEWREDLQDQIGDFAHVESIVVQWDKGEGSVSIDDLRLLPGRHGRESSRMARPDFLKLAFPAGDGRAYQNDAFFVATNAPEMDEEKSKLLLARCDEVRTLLAERYRLEGEIDERIPLVIFETKGEYGRYFDRLGEHYGLNVKPGENSTFVLGICASYYHPEYGWDRPTYSYLAASGVIRQRLGLGGSSSWILVGLASAVQVRLHPSAMPDDFVQKQIRGYVDGPKTWFKPLNELLDPETSPGAHRSQLVSLMEFLAEERPQALGRFWERVRAFREPVASLARPALLDAVDTDIDSLEGAYLDWGYDWMPDRGE